MDCSGTTGRIAWGCLVALPLAAVLCLFSRALAPPVPGSALLHSPALGTAARPTSRAASAPPPHRRTARPYGHRTAGPPPTAAPPGAARPHRGVPGLGPAHRPVSQGAVHWGVVAAAAAAAVAAVVRAARAPLAPPPAHIPIALRALPDYSGAGVAMAAVTAGPESATAAPGGCWLPIASAAGLMGDKPERVEVAGRLLVVWRRPEGGGWVVMHDACSHRLAPLSQGRVDPGTGCIECPYHGWQFDGSGACTRIPQLDPEAQGRIPPGTAVNALPVRVTGDLIWAKVPVDDPVAAAYGDVVPEEVFPEMADAGPVFSRELPYSFDFLLENFMDSSHIPYAHHGMQVWGWGGVAGCGWGRLAGGSVVPSVGVCVWVWVWVWSKGGRGGLERDGGGGGPQPRLRP